LARGRAMIAIRPGAGISIQWSRDIMTALARPLDDDARPEVRARQGSLDYRMRGQ
jgi:hypothetical protein